MSWRARCGRDERSKYTQEKESGLSQRAAGRFFVRYDGASTQGEERMRRIVSAIVFGLGLVYGLVGCAVLPGMAFCIGSNDTKAEVVAIMVCLPGMFWAAILSFWRRRMAGIVFLSLSAIWLYGMFSEYLYMRKDPCADPGQAMSELQGGIVQCLPLWLLGGFALWTAWRGWPEICGKKKAEDDANKNPAADS